MWGGRQDLKLNFDLTVSCYLKRLRTTAICLFTHIYQHLFIFSYTIKILFLHKIQIFYLPYIFYKISTKEMRDKYYVLNQ